MNKNITITNMTTQDLLSIKDVLKSDFDDFWSFSIFENELKNENSNYLIAKLDSEIVGFVGIWQCLDVIHITNIVTKKSKRNLGIASSLLQEAINLALHKKATSITLEVNIQNIPAINLYKKFHFQEVGYRKKYYNGNDDALIMTIYF